MPLGTFPMIYVSRDKKGNCQLTRKFDFQTTDLEREEHKHLAFGVTDVVHGTLVAGIYLRMVDKVRAPETKNDSLTRVGNP